MLKVELGRQILPQWLHIGKGTGTMVVAPKEPYARLTSALVLWIPRFDHCEVTATVFATVSPDFDHATRGHHAHDCPADAVEVSIMK